MKTPRKHAELIKAWADGAEIQVYDNHHEVWRNSPTPIWDSGLKYRVFVEPKPDRVEEMSVYRNMHRRYDYLRPYDEPVIAGFLSTVRVTFCGNTGAVKSMEVL